MPISIVLRPPISPHIAASCTLSTTPAQHVRLHASQVEERLPTALRHQSQDCALLGLARSHVHVHARHATCRPRRPNDVEEVED